MAAPGVLNIDNTLNMTESSSTAGYYYGRAVGFIEDPSTLATDSDLDAFTINTADGAVSGNYLNISFENGGAGSLLTDAIVTVYGADQTTVLAQVTGEADPLITDLQLAADGPLYLTVESGSGEWGGSQYYLGLVTLFDEASN